MPLLWSLPKLFRVGKNYPFTYSQKCIWVIPEWISSRGLSTKEYFQSRTIHKPLNFSQKWKSDIFGCLRNTFSMFSNTITFRRHRNESKCLNQTNDCAGYKKPAVIKSIVTIFKSSCRSREVSLKKKMDTFYSDFQKKRFQEIKQVFWCQFQQRFLSKWYEISYRKKSMGTKM